MMRTQTNQTGRGVVASSPRGADQPSGAPAVKTTATSTHSQPGSKTAETGGAGARIKHVVVLMLENRSFDQMLGLLPGVNGVKLGPDGIDPAHVNYLDPQKPDPSQAYPVHKAQYFGIPEGDIPPPTDVKGISTDLYGGPSHSFPSASQQLYNDAWGPGGSGAKGTTPSTGSGFVKGYAAELMRTYAAWAKQDTTFKVPDAPPRDHIEVAMAAFTPEQLPVINGLAEAFCVCDNWFSEVPGPTEPNRLFMHAATSVGLVHNPWEFPIGARTIYEDIVAAGGRTWGCYYYDLADTANFPVLKGQTDKILPFDRFATDLQSPSTFPNYVFLCPRYTNSEQGFANSQHAPYDVRYGEHWIADVYEALRKSAIWDNTLLVITYDEHGGFYDHVLPPDQNILSPDGIASPTAYDKTKYGYMFDSSGKPQQEYVFNFDRLGCRVPAVLVSPWIARGHVESRRLQHTSVLATVRKMWGLSATPLTAREGQAGTFEDLFQKLPRARTDCPTTLARPPLPDESLQAAMDQPLSHVQQEIFQQVNHLDGHPDSGKPAPMPKTQGEASRYIAERNLAHRRYHDARRAGGGKR